MRTYPQCVLERGGALMRRRDFIGVLGGAAAWPFASQAQQAAVPVIGDLHPALPAPNAHLAALMRQVLADDGLVNLAFEYRFAEGNYDRLPLLAAELVRRQVTLIAALNTPAALAAKAASATIPVVFSAADDPVSL